MQNKLWNIAIEELYKTDEITKGDYSLYIDYIDDSDKIAPKVIDLINDTKFINIVKSEIRNQINDVSFSQMWCKYLILYYLEHELNISDIKNDFYDPGYFLDNELSRYESNIYSFIIKQIENNNKPLFTFDELMELNNIQES